MSGLEEHLRRRVSRTGRRRPLFIIIAGGTAAGKGTLAQALARALRPRTTHINMDRYFKPTDQLPTYWSARLGRPHPDWNRPDSFFHEKLVADCRRLLSDSPGTDVLILEGILALHFPELRESAHLRLFVHTDADERIVRRLRRNMTERGMTFDEVADYYLESVRDRHLEFVEPTRRFADLVIPGGSRSRESAQREAALEALASAVQAVLAREAGVERRSGGGDGA